MEKKKRGNRREEEKEEKKRREEEKRKMKEKAKREKKRKRERRERHHKRALILSFGGELIFLTKYNPVDKNTNNSQASNRDLEALAWTKLLCTNFPCIQKLNPKNLFEKLMMSTPPIVPNQQMEKEEAPIPRVGERKIPRLEVFLLLLKNLLRGGGKVFELRLRQE
eukprot:CAMPEP_0201502174 /NCGR_PEP_ID=MMETSP0151_2-20130828/83993_1 /ASSEMBLY_ACC=CAM_ASM_000257 /TAXON_ID=200890 /ORGANISM="Paramoeba atlantica, Strain 621/1 / CCAP 1560/9" /LENGTH=165 /DNA_ID=CAMNT_0047895747 /DNA_START=137 /DNA_END=635 /DNA_ORIENTATION=+